MSVPRDDVYEADRLARVTLSCTIEPGDLRVTGLVSELGAGKVLRDLESAADVARECLPVLPGCSRRARRG